MQAREGCIRIVLMQRVQETEQLVRQWVIDATTDIDALGQIIRAKMNDEARQLRGPTLFALFSYRPCERADGDEIHHDKMTRRVYGNGSAHGDALIGETEMPNASGIVSQMMRHSEASARIALGQTLEIVEHYKSINRERNERVNVLEEKHMQVIELFEKLISLQHDRDLETMRERRADKKHDFVREKLDMLTPVLMSKVLGAHDPKGSGSLMGEELLRQFLKSLKPEQLRAIWSSLSPEQAVTMIEIYDRYGTRELAKEQGTQEAAAPSPEGAVATQTNETGAVPRESDASEKEETNK
jgi:hypothetical protein